MTVSAYLVTRGSFFEEKEQNVSLHGNLTYFIRVLLDLMELNGREKTVIAIE